MLTGEVEVVLDEVRVLSTPTVNLPFNIHERSKVKFHVFFLSIIIFSFFVVPNRSRNLCECSIATWILDTQSCRRTCD